MKSVTIKIETQADALVLTNKLIKYSYDIDMQVGHIIIDAKSILGVLGFGVGKSVRLNINTDDNRALLDDIACYIV